MSAPFSAEVEPHVVLEPGRGARSAGQLAGERFQPSGEASTVDGATARDVARITATAARWYAALDGSPRARPGIGRPDVTREREAAHVTPLGADEGLDVGGNGPQPCAAFCESASGCQNVASCTVEPAASTMSGAFAGREPGSA